MIALPAVGDVAKDAWTCPAFWTFTLPVSLIKVIPSAWTVSGRVGLFRSRSSRASAAMTTMRIALGTGQFSLPSAISRDARKSVPGCQAFLLGLSVRQVEYSFRCGAELVAFFHFLAL